MPLVQVLDLWSLFDFLMPGYMGDQSYFQRTFSKPISAGHSAKATEADQEQSTLALESLHRQVRNDSFFVAVSLMIPIVSVFLIGTSLPIAPFERGRASRFTPKDHSRLLRRFVRITDASI